MIYLQNNVFDEALERLRMIFDGHDDVIVSMSGGKDSTVLFRMALMVAQERGRLPLKVFWLDQEGQSDLDSPAAPALHQGKPQQRKPIP